MDIRTSSHQNLRRSTRSARVVQQETPTTPQEPKEPQSDRNFLERMVPIVQDTVGALGRGGVFTLNEIKEIGMNDPALAMRLGANSISPTLLKGVNSDITTGFEKSIVPVIRGVILAMDGYRTIQTFKDPTSRGFEKAMDVARVITDVVGFAGGIAAVAIPQYAALGNSMMGFSYAADTVSHAFRGLAHGGQRINAWNLALNAKKEPQAEEPKMPPTQEPPAAS